MASYVKRPNLSKSLTIKIPKIPITLICKNLIRVPRCSEFLFQLSDKLYRSIRFINTKSFSCLTWKHNSCIFTLSLKSFFGLSTSKRKKIFDEEFCFKSSFQLLLFSRNRSIGKFRPEKIEIYFCLSFLIGLRFSLADQVQLVQMGLLVSKDFVLALFSTSGKTNNS